jgi:hypothetical protein
MRELGNQEGFCSALGFLLPVLAAAALPLCAFLVGMMLSELLQPLPKKSLSAFLPGQQDHIRLSGLLSCSRHVSDPVNPHRTGAWLAPQFGREGQITCPDPML